MDHFFVLKSLDMISPESLWKLFMIMNEFLRLPTIIDKAPISGNKMMAPKGNNFFFFL